MAGRTTGDAGATDAAVTAELAQLRQSVEQLTSGLQAMLETQATQTEMIRRLLEAATAPAESEVNVAALLQRISGQLELQQGKLDSVFHAFSTLPRQFGEAVAQQVTQAMKQAW